VVAAWVVTNLFSALLKTDSSRIRVVHVITGLHVGGAERMLWKLLAYSDHTRFDMRVLCLLGDGRIGDEIRALGIPVTCLDIQSAPGAFKALGKLRRWLREASPDILQGWMYHGNLTAWFARLLIDSRTPLVWGVRQSLYNLAWEKPATARVIKFCAFISKAVTKILYNSETARGHHEGIGYASQHGESIPNGFDTEVFSPDATARSDLRHELGLESEVPIVGMIARYDPMKGHSNFLAAAALLAGQHADVHFVLVGRGVEVDNPVFAQAARSTPLVGRVHLLGERQDISAITAGLDVAVTPSVSEGFANAIGEAMSCGIACVVTDVGDSAKVVGDCGRVVAAGNPAALAWAISDLLRMPVKKRLELGLLARQRVIDEFSISAVAARYETLYESLVGSGKG
jgi:glycosyltransferase involved in cell wall biosynthesis